MSSSKYNPAADPNTMRLGSESTPYETINTVTGVTESPAKQQGQLGGIGREEGNTVLSKAASQEGQSKTRRIVSDELPEEDRARIAQGYGSKDTEMREDVGA